MNNENIRELQKDKALEAAHALAYAFIWASTKEGHFYWNAIHTRLCGIAKLQDYKTVRLNNKYTAEIRPDTKTVKVECQEIPFSKIQELAELCK